jgi:cytoskeletal protein CcmA (bactofilin family)
MAQDSSSVMNTIIGTGARFKGELALDGPATILGGFEGSISSKGQVHIGEQANCNATVDAATIVVDGNVKGDLIARERLQLNGNAKIDGNIAAATLIVAEGAAFIGHVAVGPEAVVSAQRKLATAIEAKPQSLPPTDWASQSNASKADWLADENKSAA